MADNTLQSLANNPSQQAPQADAHPLASIGTPAGGSPLATLGTPVGLNGYDVSNSVEGSGDHSDNTEGQPGIASRTYEVGPFKGVHDFAQNELVTHPTDMYHQSVEAFKKGDWKTGTKLALQLARILPDMNDPLVQAAKELVMQPVHEIKKGYQENRQAGLPIGQSAVMPSVITRFETAGSKIKQDIHNSDYSGAVAEAVDAVMDNHTVGALPVVGAMSQQIGHAASKDIRDHNWGGLAGDVIGGALDVLSFKGDGEGGPSKGAQAADTVENMTRDAALAPEEQTVYGNLSHDINTTRQPLDAARDTAEQQAESARVSAKTQAGVTRDLGEKQNDFQLADQRTTIAQGTRQARASADQGLRTSTEGAGTASAATEAAAHTDVTNTLGALSQGAAAPEDMPSIVNDALNQADDLRHKTFEEGITGENGIETRLGDQAAQVKDSPVSKAARDILREPIPEDHALVQAAKEGTGEVLKPKVADFLKQLSDGASTEGTGEKAVTTPLTDMTAHDLVQLRQQVRSWAQSFMRGDPNARALYRLLEPIDDTIQKLAESAGDDSVLQDYQGLRDNYRQVSRNLESSTAEKLRLNSPDKALNDVGDYLLSGGNSLSKLQTLRSVAGDQVMQWLSQSTIQKWKGLAEKDPAAFAKEFDKLPDAVRQAYFGSDVTKQLQDTVDRYRQSVADAATTEKGVIGQAKDTRQAARQSASIASKGASDAANATYKQNLKDLGQRYQSAVDTAQKAYDAAKTAAKDTHSQTTAPFSSSFMKNLAEGKVNDALNKGKVDVQDIRGVKRAIGDSKWRDIADGLFQRAVKNSTKANRFDPEQFMQWRKGIKDDVFHEMFGTDPQKWQAYNDAIGRIKTAATVKKLIKNGVIYPTIGAGVGKLGAAGGPLTETLAYMAGIGGAKFAFGDLVDYVANHPATWKTVSAVTSAPSKVGGVLKNAGRLGTIYSGTQDSLGGR